MIESVATLSVAEVRSRFQPVNGSEMLYAPFDQGTPEWHVARVGVTTASTFRDAREFVGGLDERQQAYVDAIKAGTDEAEARTAAGYKTKPSSQIIKDALAGKDTRTPSAAQLKLANTTAMERITGRPYGDTFETFAMRRGREEEAWARRAYESRFDVEVGEAGIIVTPDFRFGYSTDGIVFDTEMVNGQELVLTEGLIEIKTLSDLQKLREYIELSDTQEYIDQCHGGLWITGAKWIDLVFWIPDLQVLGNGNEIWVKRIHRDEDAIERLEADLLTFEKRVVAAEDFWRTPWKNSDAPLPAYVPQAPAENMGVNIMAGDLRAKEPDEKTCEADATQAQAAINVEDDRPAFTLQSPAPDAVAGKVESQQSKREKVASGVAAAGAVVGKALGEPQGVKPVGAGVNAILDWD